MPVISNNIPHVPVFPETTRVANPTGITTPINTERYGSPGRGPTVSTSETYRQVQAEMQAVLQSRGLGADQAMQLARAGDLPLGQFVRGMLIAQVLMQDPPLFDGFTRTLKTMSGRGHNVPEAVRTFFDGIERILGMETRPPAERAYEELRRHHPGLVPGGGVEPRTSEAMAAGAAGSRSPVWRVLKDFPSPTPTPDQKAAVAEFFRFARASMEEFPTRFAVDLYAFNELTRRGVSPAEYVRLASEIPPLRLINVLARAEARGRPPAHLLNEFRNLIEAGGDARDLLMLMESQYPSVAPSVSASGTIVTTSPAETAPAAARTGPSPSAGPLNRPFHPEPIPEPPTVWEPPANHSSGAPVVVERGEPALLEFVALDAREGTLSAERCAVGLFPGALVSPGRSLDLSALPVGVYLAVLAGVNSRREIGRLWVKVTVRPRGEPPKEGVSGDGAEEGTEEERRSLLAEGPFVTVETIARDRPEMARFLGEIVLPLDVAMLDPERMVAVTPSGGIIVGKGEFESGVFPHNAVLFRFLTAYVEPSDPWRRHEPVKLKASVLFNEFDARLKTFIRNPARGLADFERTTKEFFARLTEIFPHGEQSFAVARRVFETEAGRLASGDAGGEMYRVTATEKRGEAFLASAYARTGMALACAGDVAGALKGLAGAALTDADDPVYRSALGEYLQNVRDVRFGKTEPDEVARSYRTRLAHDEAGITANPAYADIGSRFLGALAPAG